MSTNQTPVSSEKSLNLNRKLDRYFLASSAFVGTALLVGTEKADASIVYSGIQNLVFPTTNGAGGIYIDLETGQFYNAITNGNGGNPLPGFISGWDINPYIIGGRPRVGTSSGQGSASATNFFSAFGTQAISIFTGGQTIDGSLTFGSDTANSARMVNTANTGPWVNVNAYMGIRFDTSTATGLFGWIHLSTGPTAGLPATVIDWAYEDSGGSIIAGAVPEPSSLALGCLAAGAVGIAAWRRRKKV